MHATSTIHVIRALRLNIPPNADGGPGYVSAIIGADNLLRITLRTTGEDDLASRLRSHPAHLQDSRDPDDGDMRTFIYDTASVEPAELGPLEREAAEARRLRAIVAMLTGQRARAEHLNRVLGDIAAERERQDRKWGPHTLDKLPDGTGLPGDRVHADRARDAYAAAAKAGIVSFRDILQEEVAEALAETEPDALREELIQVAAVCVKWAQALDRRHAAAALQAQGDAKP